MTSTSEYRTRVDKLIVRKQFVQQTINRECKALRVEEQRFEDLKQAQEIAQQVAQCLQQSAHERIARAVSRCLRAIFEDPYQFSIRFDRKRGKTEAQLILSRDGKDYEDPLNEVGGGVIDVASLSLRLACVMLSKPGRQRLLVLDEPFRNVRGKHNKKRLRAMLLSLAKDLQFQFILNVDNDAYPEFSLGEVIQL